MMNELEKKLVEDEFKLMTLTTSEQRSFYESLGFKFQGQIRSSPISRNRKNSNNLQSNQVQKSDNSNEKSESPLDNTDLTNQIPPPPPLPINKIQTKSDLVDCLQKEL